MRFLKLLTIYAGLSLGAISAAPVSADTGTLIAMASGDLGKIRFHAEPMPVTDETFMTANGAVSSIKDYQGKFVLLNFWALWCAPCREEMPALDKLNQTMNGTAFEVVTVATGRNAKPAVDAFFVEEKLTTLPKLFDPKMKMARAYGALGLPVTIMIDPQGREIARAVGALHWDSPQAVALFNTWINGS